MFVAAPLAEPLKDLSTEELAANRELKMKRLSAPERELTRVQRE